MAEDPRVIRKIKKQKPLRKARWKENATHGDKAASSDGTDNALGHQEGRMLSWCLALNMELSRANDPGD